MDQVGTGTSLVLTIKLIKDFSPAVTLLPVLTPYVGLQENSTDYQHMHHQMIMINVIYYQMKYLVIHIPVNPDFTDTLSVINQPSPEHIVPDTQPPHIQRSMHSNNG